MKFQEFIGNEIPDVSQMDVDYNEKIFEDMLAFIANLDPEALSEEQLEEVLNIIDNLEIAEEKEDEEIEESDISEVRRKVVIRKGKKVRKVICKPGYKAKGNKCVRMKAAEKLRKRKGAIRAARKRKSKKTQIARARKRSMRKRKALAGGR